MIDVQFIICSNKDEFFQIASNHIYLLRVPEEVNIQVLRVSGATSMTSGYNYAMRRSSAKYKIYMHQDVYIINPNFIFDLIGLFQSDRKLGLIGMVGAKHLPKNGIWWEAAQKYGRVIENRVTYRYLDFDGITDPVQYVDAVDGLLMATQYDLPWMEELFDGWHFYDSAQSLEFRRAGYKVGVVKQTDPWCIHDMGSGHTFDVSSYNKYRRIFVEKYKCFLTTNDII